MTPPMPDPAAPSALALVAAILGIVVGALGTLAWLVLLVASAPNSSPQQAQMIKWLMIAAAVIGVAAVVAGIWLTVAGHAWPAAAIGALPMAALIAGVVILSVRG